MLARTRRKLIDLDRDALLALAKLRAPLLDRAMRTATRMGDAETWICVAAFVLLAAPRAGILIAAGTLLATLICVPLKRLCRRSRPQRGITGFIALAEDPDAFSFPSGHSATAWSVTFALSGESGGPLAFAIATIVSISRVYLGAHYPLDVAAGAVIGIVAGLVVRFVT